MGSKNLVVGMLLGALIPIVGCDGRTTLGVLIPAEGGAPGSGNGGSVGSSLDGGVATGGSGGGAAGSIDASAGGAGRDTGIGGATGPCPVAGVNNTPSTVAGLRAALARKWLLCSPLGLTHQPQDGLVMTTNDRYAVLRRDASGVLVPQRGVDFEGSITYLVIEPGFGGGIQTNFNSDLGLSVISRPVITTNPTMLIINNNGVYEYRYVAADGP